LADFHSFKELPPLCIPVAGQDWNFASQPAIDDGISYLINLNTRINIDGTSCGRISCSYNSAIYLCNDVSILELLPFLGLVLRSICRMTIPSIPPQLTWQAMRLISRRTAAMKSGHIFSLVVRSLILTATTSSSDPTLANCVHLTRGLAFPHPQC
jgi:hypothetical protein